MHAREEAALVAAKSKVRSHGYNYPSTFAEVEVAKSRVAASAASLRSFRTMAAAVVPPVQGGTYY